MNPKNNQKYFLSILKPSNEVNYEKKGTYKNLSFRNLFKKKRIIFIFFILTFFLIAFGISKSFLLFTCAITISPLIVVFWSSFGEQIRNIFKSK